MEELNNLEHNSDGSNEKLHLSDVSCSVCGGQDILLEQKGRYRDWETDRKSTRLNSSH